MKKISKLSYFVIVFFLLILAKTTFALKEPPNLCERWIDRATCTLVSVGGPGTFYGCLTSTNEWCLP